jgi:type VI secretion system protein ImpK
MDSGDAAIMLRSYLKPIEQSRNSLIAAATPLLNLIVELAAATSHPDVPALQSTVSEEVRNFEKRAQSAGISAEHVMAARYALCAALDETVLTTSWGADSQWSQQSLLSAFHNDVWGGEKVFKLLDQLSESPIRGLDTIELIAYLLALGFEGRYRVIENGAVQLEDLRRETFRMVRRERDQPPSELSPTWRSSTRGRALRRYVPIWVVAAVAGVVLTGIFTYYENEFIMKLKPVYDRFDTVIANPLAGG